MHDDAARAASPRGLRRRPDRRFRVPRARDSMETRARRCGIARRDVLALGSRVRRFCSGDVANGPSPRDRAPVALAPALAWGAPPASVTARLTRRSSGRVVARGEPRRSSGRGASMRAGPRRCSRPGGAARGVVARGEEAHLGVSMLAAAVDTQLGAWRSPRAWPSSGARRSREFAAAARGRVVRREPAKRRAQPRNCSRNGYSRQYLPPGRPRRSPSRSPTATGPSCSAPSGLVFCHPYLVRCTRRKRRAPSGMARARSAPSRIALCWLA